MKPSEIVLKAMQLIDTPEKWSQNSPLTDDGRMCAVGALRKAENRMPYYCHDILGSAEQDLDRVFHYGVEEFNDHPETTHGDVLTLLALGHAILESEGR